MQRHIAYSRRTILRDVLEIKKKVYLAYDKK
jgi:hypothetical protein